jgi:hypothetical protein
MGGRAAHRPPVHGRRNQADDGQRDLEPKAAVEPLTKSARFKQVSILKRKVADAETLKKARKLHQELFSSLPPKTKTASLPPRAAGSRAGRAS